jgi:Methyltransferase domain
MNQPEKAGGARKMHVPHTLVGEVLEGVVIRKKKRRDYLVLAIKESPSTRSRNVAIPIETPFTIFLLSVVKVSGCRPFTHSCPRSDDSDVDVADEMIGNNSNSNNNHNNDVALLQGMLVGRAVELITCAPNSGAVRKLLEEFPTDGPQRRQMLTPTNCPPETLHELDEWLSSSYDDKLNTARGWSWLARALAGTVRDAPPLRPARVSARDLSALASTEEATELIPIHRRDFPVIEHNEEIILQGSTFYLDQERRIDYIRHKKNPQISWFVQRIYELYNGNWDQPLNILDVGGGRGDLSRVLAEYFTAARITIVDVNESSLIAGRESCGDFLNRMAFVHQDFACFPIQKFDLVVALHACGGLSDRALQYAEASQAAFVVCPCCYTKRNPRCVVHRLAELMDGPPEIPRRAQHIINSNRLRTIEYCFTSLEEYDISFSKRNMVLVGKSSE